MEKAYAAWRAFQDRFLGHAAALLFVGSTLLALVCAHVALRAWQAEGGTPALVGLALASSSLVALAAYGVWFYRKLGSLS